MIELGAYSKGRRVIYAREDPHRPTEHGIITGWNSYSVWVRYDSQRGDAHGQPTSRFDLEWETPDDAGTI